MHAEVDAREALSQRVLDGLPVAVVVLNSFGTPVYANEEAQRLLGRGVLPVGGERLGQVHELTVDGTEDPYPIDATPAQRALAGEVTRAGDIEIQHPDGPVPVRAAGAPIVGPGRRVEYAIATFTDLSGQGRPKQARSDAEAVYLGLFDQEVNSVGLLTPDGTLIDANRRPFEATGFRRQDCIGKPFWETPWFSGAPDVQEQIRAAIADAAAGNYVVDESFVFTKTGEERWAMRSLTPVRGAGGQVRNIVVVSHDITALRVAEAEARRLSAIVEGSGALMALTDGRHRMRYVNPTGRALLGLPADVPMPTEAGAYLTDHGRDVSANQVVPALMAGGQWRGRLEFRHFETGEAIELLVSASLVPDTAGREASVALVGHDLRC
ncbi:MAG: PAS domain-containing protein [Acidimicrobiia bacterium]